MLRDERGMDTHLDAAVGALLDDGEQLDLVAELVGAADVGQRDVADALHVDFVRAVPAAVCERGQDHGLVRGVESVDVERRVRLGITEPLGVLQDLLESEVFALHAGEDVVAGTVQNAEDAVDAVAHESFAQGLDDRDAAGHARLVEDRAAARFRRVEDLASVVRQQRLVRRDDRLALFEGAQDELAGNGRAADQLDHDVALRDHGRGIARQHAGRDRDAAVGRRIEIADPGQFHIHAGPFADQTAVFQKTIRHTGAYRAESEDSHTHMFHID